MAKETRDSRAGGPSVVECFVDWAPSAIGTSNYVTSALYDPAGRPTSRALGNGLTTTYAYYAWNAQGGRMSSMVTGARQNLTYSYDNLGNITQLVDGIAAETGTYAYDGLNRLTSWTLNASPPERYTYDGATGNLASKGAVTYTTYSPSHPHAATLLSNNSTYQYDANGNMTQRVVGGQTFNLGYDAENRLVSVSGAVSASFVYDGDGKRVKSVIGTTTYFVGNIYESTGGVATKYYYAGGQRIAMRVGSAAPSYILSDHLGSTTVVTDSSGNLVSELRYKPWGEQLYSSGSTPTKYTYTGQYSNASDFGLLFYNARWFDPALGRFASADSIVPAGVQGLDRYAYVNNSPVNLTDPSGHCPGPLAVPCLIALGLLIDYGPALAAAGVGALWLGGDTPEARSTPTTWAELQPRIEATLVLGTFTLPALGRAPTCSQGRCTLAPALRSPNAIGRRGEQLAAENLPIDIEQQPYLNPYTLRRRIYDGTFTGVPSANVEIKTSTSGVINATARIRGQIAADVAINESTGSTTIWVLVDARPSGPLINLLRGTGVTWHQLHVGQGGR